MIDWFVGLSDEAFVMKICNFYFITLLSLITPAFGTFTLTENFDGSEAGATLTSGFRAQITGWAESNGTGFADFVGTQSQGEFTAAGGAGSTVGLSEGGFIYNELGARTTDSYLTFSVQNFNRVGGGVAQSADVELRFYSLPALIPVSQTEVDSQDLEGLANLIGSFNIAQSAVANTVRTTTGFVDLQGIGATDQIFAYFTAPGDIGYIDNLSFESVPEPSTAALALLGMAGLLRRRR